MNGRDRQYCTSPFFSVMPDLVPGIHVLAAQNKEDVDGRDKPGHDELNHHQCICRPPAMKDMTALSGPATCKRIKYIL